MCCRTELFRNFFLPFTVNVGSKLDSDIKNSDSFAIFHRKLLAFIRQYVCMYVWYSMYGIYDLFGVRLIDWVSVIYKNISLGTILLILWTHHAHALLILKIQIIFFAAKTPDLLAQLLLDELKNNSSAINSLNSTDLE